MKVRVIDDAREWKKLEKVFAKNSRKPATVSVGVQGDDVAGAGGDLSLVDQATVHEFGSMDGRIPQRSFIRSTFDRKTATYQRLVNDVARKVLDGVIDADTALGLIGEKFVSDVKATIRAGINPPLADSTLAMRNRKIAKLSGSKNQSKATEATAAGFPSGSVTPLIDTGRMINSIRAVVEQ